MYAKIDSFHSCLMTCVPAAGLEKGNHCFLILSRPVKNIIRISYVSRFSSANFGYPTKGYDTYGISRPENRILNVLAMDPQHCLSHNRINTCPCHPYLPACYLPMQALLASYPSHSTMAAARMHTTQSSNNRAHGQHMHDT